uniref:Uncharacterized protein n=1 Tax=Chromera velia CCMP2878 TaxID=1169474 RepID=A0A0G4I2X7_9ALVE|mmetsp:Transcript_33020/g.65428  ORF Transcript_33020/g.65428 Transcript_33020/m.65428 type:complete len:491 (+) Transcript_33020:133-1605(+)|eukprot:Cvel_10518.t1-p1 / transcript=Cvel_10518.t1 / gene=Cvel_10518 / organism=Chromera_velia_CCMP2878 / gene_product=hypothetical protein / transcript_product=hypothetical protein / location=Cvel_scaffold636:43612-50377(+) / protein_length=490 / sequence_SO=supercontig / SO=protein_coding / is_pseudo=false
MKASATKKPRIPVKRKTRILTPLHMISAAFALLIGFALYAAFVPPSVTGSLTDWVIAYGGFLSVHEVQDHTGVSTLAATQAVEERRPLAFVPEQIALSYNQTGSDDLAAELVRMAKGKQGDAWDATAIALIAEARNRSSFWQPWIKTLPAVFPYSQTFTEAQRDGLVGTPGETYFRLHEAMVKKILKKTSAMNYFQETGEVTLDEAVWAVGAGIHMMVDDVFAPGLTDSLAKHWNPLKCVEVFSETIEYKGMPGYVLVAPRDIKKHERLYKWAGPIGSAEMLAMYGQAPPENPHGFTSRINPTGDKESKQKWGAEIASKTDCRPDDFTKVVFKLGPEMVSERQIRCVSMFMVDETKLKGAERLDAMAFFEVWPRVEELARPEWIKMEDDFYANLVESCSSQKEALSAASPDSLRALEESDDPLDKRIVAVREQLVDLLTRCEEDFSERRKQLPQKLIQQALEEAAAEAAAEALRTAAPAEEVAELGEVTA